MKDSRELKNEAAPIEGSGLRIVESRECWGCGVPCGEAQYCRKCAVEIKAEEIWTLEQLYKASGDDQGASALRRAAAFVRRWLWLPGLIVTGAGLAVFGWDVAGAVIEWIERGGIQ